MVQKLVKQEDEQEKGQGDGIDKQIDEQNEQEFIQTASIETDDAGDTEDIAEFIYSTDSTEDDAEDGATGDLTDEEPDIVLEPKEKDIPASEPDKSKASTDPLKKTKFDIASVARKVIRDTPLAELTFRKYEMPYEEDARELLRKLCLSIGLLQPGDSRDIIVDVLHVILQAKREKKPLNSEQIRNLVIEERKNMNLPMLGIASSNVRRQIKRLRNIFLVEKVKNEYMIAEFSSMELTFKEKIESFLLPSILGRLREYLKSIDKKFE